MADPKKGKKKTMEQRFQEPLIPQEDKWEEMKFPSGPFGERRNPFGGFSPHTMDFLTDEQKFEASVMKSVWRAENDPENQRINEWARKTENRNTYIADNRKMRATTGKPIDPNVDLIGGKYNLNIMDPIMEYAKKHKLSKEDLWNLTAIGMQESKIGKKSDNVGHLLGDFEGKDINEKFVLAYIDKMKTAERLKLPTPEQRLQVYNGTGTIKRETEADYHGFEMQKIYGVPIPEEGLNLGKNPLYGIQVMDIKENVLKKSPPVQKYIDSTYNTFHSVKNTPTVKLKKGGVVKSGAMEVEGGELALKNRNGDVAIVPKDKAFYVQNLINKGEHAKIDSFISMLPKVSNKTS
jgi:hypothetical protein